MRLFHLNLGILTPLLAIAQVAIGFALPTYTNTLLASAKGYPSLEKRANPQLTVSLKLVALETWEGSNRYTGLFGNGLSNSEVQAAAKQTYESLTGNLPGTLLVSVISIPGKGLVAGTIWRAGSQFFESSAQASAPYFWAAVPGPDQALLDWADNNNKWHSEAVAARLAERKFSESIREGRWPDGTKIATYGKVNNGAAGPKSACSEDATSVSKPCGGWLPILNIQIL